MRLYTDNVHYMHAAQLIRALSNAGIQFRQNVSYILKPNVLVVISCCSVEITLAVGAFNLL
jgi:hypothetical protein